jgi:hypothetical protein
MMLISPRTSQHRLGVETGFRIVPSGNVARLVNGLRRWDTQFKVKTAKRARLAEKPCSAGTQSKVKAQRRLANESCGSGQ